MVDDNDDWSATGQARQRLADQLEKLAKQGLTQTQIATKSGLPPQYISDIKHGRRPMSELVARRLSEAFDVNFQWLMGIESDSESARPSPVVNSNTSSVWMPLFSHPIEGEPRTHPKWDGTGIEVAGAAAARLVLATLPYVLKFGHNDIQGRLKKGDLVLVSQARNDDAEIQIVKHRKKAFLARVGADGNWIRVANGNTIPSDAIVTGHCVGIVWSPLI